MSYQSSMIVDIECHAYLSDLGGDPEVSYQSSMVVDVKSNVMLTVVTRVGTQRCPTSPVW